MRLHVAHNGSPSLSHIGDNGPGLSRFGGGGGSTAPSAFATMNAAGTSYSTPLIVQSANNTNYTVPLTVLSAGGVSYSPV